MTARRALLLACGRFDDPELPALRSPERDAAAFEEVLSGLDYEVSTVTDCGVQEARRAIAVFLEGARRTDVNLIYFSCHGIQDPDGNLYFAFSDSQYTMPDVSAVPADFVRHRISGSRSRSTILIIDCCFSGAFLHGMKAKAGRSAGVDALVRDLPEGSGVAVLTSSGATEVSLEDPGNRGEAARRGSYFTEAVITGLVTGAADRDHDGRITVDELFSYASDRVADGPSHQKPCKFVNAVGEMVVANVGVHTNEPPTPTPPTTAADTVMIAPDVLAPWPPLPQTTVVKSRPLPTPTSSAPRHAAVEPISLASRHTTAAPISPASRGTAAAPISRPPRRSVAPVSPAPHSTPRRPAPPRTSPATGNSFAAAPGVYGRKRGPNPRLPVLVGTAVLLTAGAVAFLVPRVHADRTPAAEVPSVTGLSPAAAEKALREAKLTPRPRATPSAGTSAPDCRGDLVTGQWPGPGSNVNAGTAVEYAVCPPVTVPKLKGLSEDDAKKALTNAKLESEKGRNTTAHCSPGTVGDQDPKDHVSAGRGSKVVYRMCTRPKPQDMREPVLCELVGLSEAAAKARVADDGRFSVETVHQNSTGEIGKVFSQEPGCGETAERGSPITLFVSDGPGTSPPPPTTTTEPTDPTPPATNEDDPARTTN
jgi:beta-lactam-binding protein with PASTA domain